MCTHTNGSYLVKLLNHEVLFALNGVGDGQLLLEFEYFLLAVSDFFFAVFAPVSAQWWSHNALQGEAARNRWFCRLKHVIWGSCMTWHVCFVTTLMCVYSSFKKLNILMQQFARCQTALVEWKKTVKVGKRGRYKRASYFETLWRSRKKSLNQHDFFIW